MYAGKKTIKVGHSSKHPSLIALFFSAQVLVEPRRIELLTSCVQGRRSPS